MSALVFLDTETTGLSLDDDIWEFAAVRREPSGEETELHLFIEHEAKKCARLPESFRADHQARFPACGSDLIVNRTRAAVLIADLLHGRPHVVGAVPNFDTERLALLLSRANRVPGWHYHLIDVETLAVGYLAGVRAAGQDAAAPPLPWNSDDLSRMVGVEPPTDERHTAMGDVRWTMALYDAIVTDGGRPLLNGGAA